MATIGQSPVGAIEELANPKRRYQVIYWRPHINPDGVMEWVQTMPLPADPVNRNIYFSKGFRLNPPSIDESTIQVAPDEEKDALLSEVARLKAELESAKSSIVQAVSPEKHIRKRASRKSNNGNKEGSK